MTAYLVDSDVLIDVLRGGRDFARAPDDSYAVSVVTRAELYSGRSADGIDLDRFLAPYEELDVDPGIATRAGRTRRLTGLPLADAMIAATAVATGRVLLTRNVRHFARVGGLDVRSPADP